MNVNNAMLDGLTYEEHIFCELLRELYRLSILRKFEINGMEMIYRAGHYVQHQS